MTNKCTIISQIITLQMFRNYRVILRELVINTFPRYASISDAAVVSTAASEILV